MNYILTTSIQARAAAASAMCAHAHATQQRHQLLQWRVVAAHTRSVRELLLYAQRHRTQRTLAAALRCWREHLHIDQLKRTRRTVATAWACRRRLVSALTTWATASKQQAAERDAALQTLLQHRTLRSASAVLLVWRITAHEMAIARSTAAARLSNGLERCRLHACLSGWTEHTAAARRMTALLEGHAGRRRRRQLRRSFLAWGGAVREAAEGRDVLAGCFASNAADRRRAAVLEAWHDAAKWSAYVRMAVAQCRHEFLHR